MNYKLKYKTPEGVQEGEFDDTQTYEFAKRNILDHYGAGSIVEDNGPNIGNGKIQILSE